MNIHQMHLSQAKKTCPEKHDHFSLVNEHKLIRMRLHGRKTVFELVSAALLHMGAQPLGGDQRLFNMCTWACAGTVRWRQRARKRQW